MVSKYHLVRQGDPADDSSQSSVAPSMDSLSVVAPKSTTGGEETAPNDSFPRTECRRRPVMEEEPEICLRRGRMNRVRSDSSSSDNNTASISNNGVKASFVQSDGVKATMNEPKTCDAVNIESRIPRKSTNRGISNPVIPLSRGQVADFINIPSDSVKTLSKADGQMSDKNGRICREVLSLFADLDDFPSSTRRTTGKYSSTDTQADQTIGEVLEENKFPRRKSESQTKEENTSENSQKGLQIKDKKIFKSKSKTGAKHVKEESGLPPVKIKPERGRPRKSIKKEKPVEQLSNNPNLISIDVPNSAVDWDMDPVVAPEIVPSPVSDPVVTPALKEEAVTDRLVEIANQSDIVNLEWPKLVNRPLVVNSDIEGFSFIGFHVQVVIKCGDWKNRSSWVWAEGVLKYWYPKFGRYFIHFLENQSPRMIEEKNCDPIKYDDVNCDLLWCVPRPHYSSNAGKRGWFSASDDEIRLLSPSPIWRHPTSLQRNYDEKTTREDCNDLLRRWYATCSNERGNHLQQPFCARCGCIAAISNYPTPTSQTAVVCDPAAEVPLTEHTGEQRAPDPPTCPTPNDLPSRQCCRCNKLYHVHCLSPHQALFQTFLQPYQLCKEARLHRQFCREIQRQQRAQTSIQPGVGQKRRVTSCSHSNKRRKTSQLSPPLKKRCAEKTELAEAGIERRRSSRTSKAPKWDDEDDASSLTESESEEFVVEKTRRALGTVVSPVGGSGEECPINSYAAQLDSSIKARGDLTADVQPEECPSVKACNDAEIYGEDFSNLLESMPPDLIQDMKIRIRNSKGKISNSSLMRVLDNSNELLTSSQFFILANGIRAMESRQDRPRIKSNFKLEIEREPDDSKEDYPLLDDIWICPDCLLCSYCYEPLSDVPVVQPSELSVLPLIDATGSPIVLTNTVVCHSCGLAAHGACCYPEVPTLHINAKWRCDRCTKCGSCGYQDLLWPDYTGWDVTFEHCVRCYRAIEKGEYCPICRAIWGARDGSWLQCEGCRLWLHSTCDESQQVVLGPTAQQMTSSVKRDLSDHLNGTYRCPVCRGGDRKARYLRVLEQLIITDRWKCLSYPVPRTFLNYWRVVKRPMNFSEMKVKVYRDDYADDEEFMTDFALIIHNAKIVHMPNTKIYKNASSIEKKAYDLIASILDIPKLSKTYLSRLHKSAALLSSTISTTPPYAVDVNQCFDLERLAVASLLNSENTAAPSDSQMLSPGEREQFEVEDYGGVQTSEAGSPSCLGFVEESKGRELLRSLNRTPFCSKLLPKNLTNQPSGAEECSPPLCSTKVVKWLESDKVESSVILDLTSSPICLYCNGTHILSSTYFSFTSPESSVTSPESSVTSLVCIRCCRFAHLECAGLFEYSPNSSVRLFICHSCSLCDVCGMSIHQRNKNGTDREWNLLKISTQSDRHSLIALKALFIHQPSSTDPFHDYRCISCCRSIHLECLWGAPFDRTSWRRNNNGKDINLALRIAKITGMPEVRRERVHIPFCESKVYKAVLELRNKKDRRDGKDDMPIGGDRTPINMNSIMSELDQPCQMKQQMKSSHLTSQLKETGEDITEYSKTTEDKLTIFRYDMERSTVDHEIMKFNEQSIDAEQINNSNQFQQTVNLSQLPLSQLPSVPTVLSDHPLPSSMPQSPIPIIPGMSGYTTPIRDENNRFGEINEKISKTPSGYNRPCTTWNQQQPQSTCFDLQSYNSSVYNHSTGYDITGHLSSSDPGQLAPDCYHFDLPSFDEMEDQIEEAQQPMPQFQHSQNHTVQPPDLPISHHFSYHVPDLSTETPMTLQDPLKGIQASDVLIGYSDLLTSSSSFSPINYSVDQIITRPSSVVTEENHYVKSDAIEESLSPQIDNKLPINESLDNIQRVKQTMTDIIPVWHVISDQPGTFSGLRCIGTSQLVPKLTQILRCGSDLKQHPITPHPSLTLKERSLISGVQQFTNLLCDQCRPSHLRHRRRAEDGINKSREHVPMQDVPMQDVPMEDVPMEDVPMEDVPMKDVPMKDVPMEDVPMKDVPMKDVSMKDVPMESSLSEDVKICIPVPFYSDIPCRDQLLQRSIPRSHHTPWRDQETEHQETRAGKSSEIEDVPGPRLVCRVCSGTCAAWEFEDLRDITASMVDIPMLCPKCRSDVPDDQTIESPVVLLESIEMICDDIRSRFQHTQDVRRILTSLAESCWSDGTLSKLKHNIRRFIDSPDFMIYRPRLLKDGFDDIDLISSSAEMKSKSSSSECPKLQKWFTTHRYRPSTSDYTSSNTTFNLIRLNIVKSRDPIASHHDDDIVDWSHKLSELIPTDPLPTLWIPELPQHQKAVDAFAEWISSESEEDRTSIEASAKEEASIIMGILHRFFKWRRQSGDQTSDYSPLHKAFFALPNVVIQTLNSIHRQSRQFPPFGSYSKFNYSSSALSSKRLNLLAFEMSRLDQRLSPSSNSRPLCSLCGCQSFSLLGNLLPIRLDPLPNSSNYEFVHSECLLWSLSPSVDKKASRTRKDSFGNFNESSPNPLAPDLLPADPIHLQHFSILVLLEAAESELCRWCLRSGATVTCSHCPLNNEDISKDKFHVPCLFMAVNDTPMTGWNIDILKRTVECPNCSKAINHRLKTEHNRTTHATSSAPDLQTSSAPDLQTSLAPDLQTSSAPDLQTSLAPDLQTSLAPDLQTSSAPDLQTSSAPDLQTSSAPDLQTSDNKPDVVVEFDLSITHSTPGLFKETEGRWGGVLVILTRYLRQRVQIAESSLILLSNSEGSGVKMLDGQVVRRDRLLALLGEETFKSVKLTDLSVNPSKLYQNFDGPMSHSIFRLISTGSLLPTLGHVQGPHLVGFRSIRKFWALPAPVLQRLRDNLEISPPSEEGSRNSGDEDLKIQNRLCLYRCSIDQINGDIWYSISSLDCTPSLFDITPSDRQSWIVISLQKSLSECMATFKRFFNCWSDQVIAYSAATSFQFPFLDEEFFGLLAPPITNIVEREYPCIKTVQLLQCGLNIALKTVDTKSEKKFNRESDNHTLDSAVIDVRKLSRTHRARIWLSVLPPHRHPVRELGHSRHSISLLQLPPTSEWRASGANKREGVISSSVADFPLNRKTEGSTAVASTRSALRKDRNRNNGSCSGRARQTHKFDKMPPAMQYRSLLAMSVEDRVRACLSPIHGLGLFAVQQILRGDPVVEYLGDVIRNVVADKREKFYESQGNNDASCYMFRLDGNFVVDATTSGNVARFINHSCEPNCCCRVITSESDSHHIVIFASRDINIGEEITYDYKFNVEEESLKLKCRCGASSCLGRMN